jgi:cysteine synthase
MHSVFVQARSATQLTLRSVCTAAGDRVPGPRSFALLAPVKFPWREAVDAIEEVGSKDAFSLSLQLSREGLICGPSSGFNLKGMLFIYSPSDDSQQKGSSTIWVSGKLPVL